MIVRCRTNRGFDLPGDHRGLYFTRQTAFALSLDRDYQVHAMSLFNDGLLVLIVDDTRQPDWYPVELFTIEDGRLPAHWQFALRPVESAGAQAIWGYARLVDDPTHEISLAEHDNEAIAVFWQNTKAE